MIIVDNITIIISAIVLVLAIASPWINILVRRPRIKTDDYDTDEASDEEGPTQFSYPDVSVVITTHDNAPELRANLPSFLDQDYPAAFKVIVVTCKGDSDDEDVLKQFSGNPHLYTTYIPDSSRYMSRRKLAITLGVKASNSEWIMLSDITSKPDTDQWLRTMARNCADGNSLVIGYSRYEEQTRDYRKFERLLKGFYLMRETLHGHTYACDSTCIMFRKSDFVREEGFRGNLKYLRGEYDFLANKYAQPMTVALENNPKVWMTEQEPTDKEWRNRRLFYMETRRHLQRSASHRLPIIVDQAALHVNYLAIIGAAIFGMLSQRWIIVASAALAFLLTVIIRTAIASKAFREWDTGIPAWKAVPFEISVAWRQISYRIRYMRADKNDFISHKI